MESQFIFKWTLIMIIMITFNKRRQNNRNNNRTRGKKSNKVTKQIIFNLPLKIHGNFLRILIWIFTLKSEEFFFCFSHQTYRTFFLPPHSHHNELLIITTFDLLWLFNYLLSLIQLPWILTFMINIQLYLNILSSGRKIFTCDIYISTFSSLFYEFLSNISVFFLLLRPSWKWSQGRKLLFFKW